MRHMRMVTAALLSGVVLAGLVPGAGVAAGHERGALLSATPVAGMTAGQVATYLTGYGLDASRARHGVDATRIVYRTVDPGGRSTTASALVVVPRTRYRTPRQVTWLHGTTAYRGSVASVSDGNDRAAAVLFASAGYLTTAPDYLGLGVGPGTHPYVHPPSTVTASIDALRAARQLAARDGRRPDPRVLVTGHSQGGQATMALGRALQRESALGALAPIAGPMRPSTLIDDALDGTIANGVAYLAYWTVAWNRLYHLYDTPAEAFRDPSVEALFDGEHRNEDIIQRMPPTVADLFTADYLARLQHPTGVLRDALAESDRSCDWHPRVPVRLYASGGDRDVPIENSYYCRERLGGRSPVIDLGTDVDHGEVVDLALPLVLADFDSIRTAG
jgi:pimeloyl-ACP methyl ester carboxylesterase